LRPHAPDPHPSVGTPIYMSLSKRPAKKSQLDKE
jgi:hypothetical protein